MGAGGDAAPMEVTSGRGDEVENQALREVSCSIPDVCMCGCLLSFPFQSLSRSPPLSVVGVCRGLCVCVFACVVVVVGVCVLLVCLCASVCLCVHVCMCATL